MRAPAFVLLSGLVVAGATSALLLAGCAGPNTPSPSATVGCAALGFSPTQCRAIVAAAEEDLGSPDVTNATVTVTGLTAAERQAIVTAALVANVTLTRSDGTSVTTLVGCNPGSDAIHLAACGMRVVATGRPVP